MSASAASATIVRSLELLGRALRASRAARIRAPPGACSPRRLCSLGCGSTPSTYATRRNSTSRVQAGLCRCRGTDIHPPGAGKTAGPGGPNIGRVGASQASPRATECRAQALDGKYLTLWADDYAAVAPCALAFAAADVDSVPAPAVLACASLGLRTLVFRCGTTSAHCATAHEERFGVGWLLGRESLPAHGMRLDVRWQQLAVARGSLWRAGRARAARGTPADAAWRWEGSASPAARDVAGL